MAFFNNGARNQGSSPKPNQGPGTAPHQSSSNLPPRSPQAASRRAPADWVQQGYNKVDPREILQTVRELYEKDPTAGKHPAGYRLEPGSLYGSQLRVMVISSIVTVGVMFAGVETLGNAAGNKDFMCAAMAVVGVVNCGIQYVLQRQLEGTVQEVLGGYYTRAIKAAHLAESLGWIAHIYHVVSSKNPIVIGPNQIEWFSHTKSKKLDWVKEALHDGAKYCYSETNPTSRSADAALRQRHLERILERTAPQLRQLQAKWTNFPFWVAVGSGGFGALSAMCGVLHLGGWLP